MLNIDTYSFSERKNGHYFMQNYCDEQIYIWRHFYTFSGTKYSKIKTKVRILFNHVQSIGINSTDRLFFLFVIDSKKKKRRAPKFT